MNPFVAFNINSKAKLGSGWSSCCSLPHSRVHECSLLTMYISIYDVYLHVQFLHGLRCCPSHLSVTQFRRFLWRVQRRCSPTGAQNDLNGLPCERLTFHNQRKSHLSLRLSEVDPFGNYSSPHYKGTAVFHKVSRGQLEWRGDGPVPMDAKLLGEPVCKLSLTLPKVREHSPGSLRHILNEKHILTFVFRFISESENRESARHGSGEVMRGDRWVTCLRCTTPLHIRRKYCMYCCLLLYIYLTAIVVVILTVDTSTTCG